MSTSARGQIRKWVAFSALMLSFAATGCGASKGKVSGKVYYKDTPLKGGTVTFIDADKQSYLAEIQEDGSYAIDKVSPGEFSIGVETASLQPPNPNAMRNRPPADAQGNYKPPDFEARARRFIAIPGRYSDPGQSGLKYSVKTGKQEHDIKLEG